MWGQEQLRSGIVGDGGDMQDRVRERAGHGIPREECRNRGDRVSQVGLSELRPSEVAIAQMVGGRHDQAGGERNDPDADPPPGRAGFSTERTPRHEPRERRKQNAIDGAVEDAPPQ